MAAHTTLYRMFAAWMIWVCMTLAPRWPAYADSGVVLHEQVQALYARHANTDNNPAHITQLRSNVAQLVSRYRAMQHTPHIEGFHAGGELNALCEIAFQRKYGVTKTQLKTICHVARVVRTGDPKDADRSKLREDLATVATHLDKHSSHAHRPDQLIKRLTSLLTYWDGVAHPERGRVNRLQTGIELELRWKTAEQKQTLLNLLDFADKTLGSLLDNRPSSVTVNHLTPEEIATLDALTKKAQISPNNLNLLEKIKIKNLSIRQLGAQVEDAFLQAKDRCQIAAFNLAKSLRALTKAEILTVLDEDSFYDLLRGGTAHQDYGTSRVIAGILMDEDTVKQHHLRSRSVRYINDKDAQTGLTGVETDTYWPSNSASQAATHAFGVSDALGFDLNDAHGHMSFELGVPRIERQPERIAARVDHFRRANLFGELMIAGMVGRLEKTSDTLSTFFDFSNAQKLDLLWHHLSFPAVQLERADHNALKMCAVGYRMGIYGDDTANAIDGYEVRLIKRSQKTADFLEKTLPRLAQHTQSHTTTVSGPKARAVPPAIHSWINALQRSVSTQDFIIDADTINQWAQYQQLTPYQLISKLHYYDPYKEDSEIIDALPTHIRRVITSTTANRLLQELPNNYAIGMLLHDWSLDTIWTAHTPGLRQKALANVQASQVAAIKLLQTGDLNAQQIQNAIIQFVTQSGLIEHVADSLDMPNIAAIQRHF